MTKQERWQRKQCASGCCGKCGKPRHMSLSPYYCNICHIKAKVASKKRHAKAATLRAAK
jgi:hypothetical protein